MRVQLLYVFFFQPSSIFSKMIVFYFYKRKIMSKSLGPRDPHLDRILGHGLVKLGLHLLGQGCAFPFPLHSGQAIMLQHQTLFKENNPSTFKVFHFAERTAFICFLHGHFTFWRNSSSACLFIYIL